MADMGLTYFILLFLKSILGKMSIFPFVKNALSALKTESFFFQQKTIQLAFKKANMWDLCMSHNKLIKILLMKLMPESDCTKLKNLGYTIVKIERASANIH